MANVLPTGKIDIHNRAGNYARAIYRFKNDDGVDQKDRRLILKFLHDCEAGKTIKNRAKKKISPGRCNRLLDMLVFICRSLPVPMHKMTQRQLEKFILDFERDRFRKKLGDKYSSSTKRYYKIGLRKFGGWLREKQLTQLDFSFMDTYDEPKEISALSREQVERMADSTADPLTRCIVMVLFDSGARVEEFLNIRLKHLQRKDDYYMVRIEFSKTKPRTVAVPFCQRFIDAWLEHHPDARNPEAQLAPLTYGNLRKILHRLGRKALGRSVNPHLLRHSSATYYCTKLNQYQLCYRYGWSMSSKEPARYIDRQGLPEEETAKKIKTDEISKYREETNALKEDVALIKEDNAKLNKELALRRGYDDVWEEVVKRDQVKNLIKEVLRQQFKRKQLR